MADEIPLVLRQAAQLTDCSARQDPAEVMAKPVERTAVGIVERTDRVVMQRADMIRFEKRIDRELPVYPALQNPRLVMVEGVETIRREVGCEVTQKAIDIEGCPR